MNLKTADIKRIIKERPNRALVDAAQAQAKKLAVHIAGIGMDDYLEKINSFENDDQKRNRQKYAKSNVDLFDRVTRPIDEVFTARGGSVHYNLPQTQERQFREALSSVEWGYSLRRWMDRVARIYYLMDPMGMVYMEVSPDGSAYPTYKSVMNVYDYQPNGRDLEYIIFKTNKKDEFRVVDDTFDRIVRFDGESIRTVSDQTFPNYFGYVPGRILSDIIKPGTMMFTSILWTVVELADQYLRDGSVKSIFKLLHGFPKYWQYGAACPTCNGTKYVGADLCKTCNGTGKKLKYDPADSITLPIPREKDPVLAPDVAGYVTPDIDGWKTMTDELTLLEALIERTVWGTHRREDASNDTATGRFIDVQPVNRRLNEISDWAEDMEKFVTDAMGEFMYPQTYKPSSVSYGRRYLIESPDTLWEKYEKARGAGSPQCTLDELLKDYFHAKYSHDHGALHRALRLMKLEPFVHQSIAEAKIAIGETEDYIAKVYFSEWLGTLQEPEILVSPLETLRANLKAYAAAKEKAPQAQPQPIGFNN
ncbi:hypothetical protein [Chitinophaga sp. YIM B06452]|uniref:hypothetical protein n=1 Tax=Chitinophaga sp. YIM B06452 TaxID=3082158 RepID=UPI0031FEEDC6